MTEAITNWLQNTFTADPYWLTALISVIPMIEVRGAITLGINLGLNPWITWLLACVSALIVCPILLFFLVPVLKMLKKVKIFASLADGLEDLFLKKAEKIEAESHEGVTETAKNKIIMRKTVSIFLFVAIPLPLTGVWTGSAIAAFLDLKYKYSVPAIVLGNFVSGLIITLLNLVLGEHSPLIFLILLVFVIVSVISLITAVLVKQRKKEKKSAENFNEREEKEKALENKCLDK